MSKAKREAKKQAKKQKKQAGKRAILRKAKPITKVKKKHWYFIIAPKAFNERVLGKSLVPEANVLLGKTVRANLMGITGNVKKQSSVITFKINNIKDNKAVTRIEKYELMPAAVKRLVRRRQDKIESSFIVKTRDNINLRVKPLILTIFKSKKSVRTALIKKAEKMLTEYFNKNNFATAIQDLISFRIQSTLKRQLLKIFPVRLCEIRFLERIIDKKKKPEEEPEIEEPVTKIETLEKKEEPEVPEKKPKETKQEIREPEEESKKETEKEAAEI